MNKGERGQYSTHFNTSSNLNIPKSNSFHFGTQHVRSLSSDHARKQFPCFRHAPVIPVMGALFSYRSAYAKTDIENKEEKCGFQNPVSICSPASTRIVYCVFKPFQKEAEGVLDISKKLQTLYKLNDNLSSLQEFHLGN